MFLLSDGYLGLDQQYNVHLDVIEPCHVPVVCVSLLVKTCSRFAPIICTILSRNWSFWKCTGATFCERIFLVSSDIVFV